MCLILRRCVDISTPKKYGLQGMVSGFVMQKKTPVYKSKYSYVVKKRHNKIAKLSLTSRKDFIMKSLQLVNDSSTITL